MVTIGVMSSNGWGVAIRDEETTRLQPAPSSQPRPSRIVVMVARTDALRMELGSTTVRPDIDMTEP